MYLCVYITCVRARSLAHNQAADLAANFPAGSLRVATASAVARFAEAPNSCWERPSVRAAIGRLGTRIAAGDDAAARELVAGAAALPSSMLAMLEQQLGSVGLEQPAFNRRLKAILVTLRIHSVPCLALALSSAARFPLAAARATSDAGPTTATRAAGFQTHWE
jgi:hypothetical protein